MSRKIESIQSGQDVCNWIQKHPETKNIRWAGDHLTAEGPEGRITSANSRYEFPPYLRKKIICQLIAIGLGVVLLAVVLSNFA